MHQPSVLLLPLLLLGLPSTIATPSPSPKHSCNKAPATPLPLILWHGLGDTSSSDGVLATLSLYQNLTHIPSKHSNNNNNHRRPPPPAIAITLADTPSLDRRASFLGSVPSHLQTACAQLLADPAIAHAEGLVALGFSQGGQFLRALPAACPGLPRIHTLLTLGGQHNGIARFPWKACAGPWDLTCRAAHAIVDRAAWGAAAQGGVVPAQYLRDPAQLELYRERSGWIASAINDYPEEEQRNATVKERFLKGVGRMVMAVWDNDETVVPKESGWFDEVLEKTDEDTGNVERTVVKLRDREFYKEDWLGLKEMDKRKGLVFVELNGGHMQVSDKVLGGLFCEYFGACGGGDDEKKRKREGYRVLETDEEYYSTGGTRIVTPMRGCHGGAFARPIVDWFSNLADYHPDYLTALVRGLAGITLALVWYKLALWMRMRREQRRSSGYQIVGDEETPAAEYYVDEKMQYKSMNQEVAEAREEVSLLEALSEGRVDDSEEEEEKVSFLEALREGRREGVPVRVSFFEVLEDED